MKPHHIALAIIVFSAAYFTLAALGATAMQPECAARDNRQAGWTASAPMCVGERIEP